MQTSQDRVRSHPQFARLLACACCGIVLLLAGCRADMQNQPYYRPCARATSMPTSARARPIIAGTVARGHLDADTYFYTGKIGSNDGDYMPFPVTQEVLAARPAALQHLLLALPLAKSVTATA